MRPFFFFPFVIFDPLSSVGGAVALARSASEAEAICSRTGRYDFVRASSWPAVDSGASEFEDVAP